MMDQQILSQWITNQGDDVLSLEYPLNKDSWVLELGGYQGWWSSRIASKYDCNIIIVEPVPEYFDKLSLMFQDNKKVKLVNNAISSIERDVVLNIGTDGTSETMIESDTKVTVKAITLETVLSSFNVEQIDLMQMNIEGEEYPLMKHLVDTELITKIKNIQVQFHMIDESSIKKREYIQEGLYNLGYRLKWNYDFVWESWTIFKPKS
jgi:FkbM family methyltransferase